MDGAKDPVVGNWQTHLKMQVRPVGDFLLKGGLSCHYNIVAATNVHQRPDEPSYQEGAHDVPLQPTEPLPGSQSGYRSL